MITVERLGLGYVGADSMSGVQFAIDRLTWRSGELFGDLAMSQVGPGSITRGRYNLSSITARGSLAKSIAGLVEGPVDVRKLLTEFCERVLDAESLGDPAVRIGRNPRRESVPMLIHPILPEKRSTIIFGEEGTGKSTLAAAIAVTAASGKPAFSGWWAPPPCTVLVLDWEGDEDEWNDHIAQIAAGMGIEPPEIVYQPMGAALTTRQNETAKLVAEINAGLVIVDSVGLASPQRSEGGSAEESAIRLFATLRLFGTTNVLVDHVSKVASASEHGATRPYGSTYKSALARATFELRAGGEPDQDGTRHLMLVHRKGNLTAPLPPVGIRVMRSGGCVQLLPEHVDDDPRLVGALSLSERARRLLVSDGALSTKDMAERLNTTPANLRSIFRRNTSLFLVVGKDGKDKIWGVAAHASEPNVTVSRDNVSSVTRDRVGGVLRTHPPNPSRDNGQSDQSIDEPSWAALMRANEARQIDPEMANDDG